VSSYGYVETSERLDAAAAEALAAGEHLWIGIATFRLTEHEAEQVGAGASVMLGGHNLLNIAPPGCYLCETPFTSARGHRCKGNPIRYGRQGQPYYADGSAGYS
jgi:hypothetical protein